MFDKKEMKLVNFEKAKKYLMEGVQVYMENLDGSLVELNEDTNWKSILFHNLKGGSYSGSHSNLGYLQLPVNLGYRLTFSGDVSLLASLGPYVGLGVLGKDVEKVSGAKVKTDVFGTRLQRFDFGLNYKLGVEVWDQWQFYLGFEHSLLNLSKTKIEGSSSRTRVTNFYIGTAYMF